MRRDREDSYSLWLAFGIFCLLLSVALNICSLIVVLDIQCP